MRIVDLDPGDPRLETELLPVLQELRPHLTPESFGTVYAEGYPQGLRYLAGYVDGRCVAVAGWRTVINTVHLKKLYVDDLVTAEDHRSRGAGRARIAELARRARAAGCTVLDLDSAVHRSDAHRFYMREGLIINAFHFGRVFV